MNNDVKLTVKQLEKIKHALGNERMYRRHYNTITDDESWDKLVEIGYATKRDMGELGGITYFVTDQAINDLKDILW